MSENDQETARAYRERAEELRRIAANFVHVRSRRDLITVAEEWERMAERLEVQTSATRGPVLGLTRNPTRR